MLLGMRVESAGGELGLDQDEWHALLKIARYYGWEPRGTGNAKAVRRSVDPLIDGGYLVNDDCWLTEADAGELARTLEEHSDNIADLPVQPFIRVCRSGAVTVRQPWPR